MKNERPKPNIENFKPQQREIVSESMNFVSAYIKKISEYIYSEDVGNFINEIIDANRIFLVGAGRSGLEARAFAMRLMHLGFDTHAIGDATAPLPTTGDLVIIISGSGNTRSIIDLGTSIKIKGPKMAIITTNKESSLGKISDIVVIIPVIIEDIDKNLREYFLPLGTLFEAITHIFLDAIISELKYRNGITEVNMKDRHLLSEYAGIL